MNGWEGRSLTLLPVILGFVFGDGEVLGAALGARVVDAAGVPEEVLQKLVRVLLLDHHAGLRARKA